MIYDCFIFFNELDLLELRLNVLAPVVDKFVLVEATKTFQGKDKPLVFSENKHRFDRFLDKIVHVVVDEYPENPSGDPWSIECHQRRMIEEGLAACRPDDIILVSDVDEIPDPGKIAQHSAQKGISILCHRMFYYFLNCESIRDATIATVRHDPSGTVMLRMRDARGRIDKIRELSCVIPTAARRSLAGRAYWTLWLWWKARTRVNFIEDAGWHFCFLGGAHGIIEKLEAFSHVEFNSPEYKDPEKIESAIDRGIDILGREFRYRIVPLDETFPAYLRDNRHRFEHLIKGLPSPARENR